MSVISLEQEKEIVFNLLKTLYQESYASLLFQSFYSTSSSSPSSLMSNTGQPLFISSNSHLEYEEPPAAEPISVSPCTGNFISSLTRNSVPIKSFAITVDGFTLCHYAGVPFPKFTIRIVRQGDVNQRFIMDSIGSVLSLESIPCIQVKFSIWNKWANVTTDVLSNRNRIHWIKNGKLEVDDLVIHEVSVKNGGYFILHIEPIGNDETDLLISSWDSEKIVINSERTLLKRKKSLKAIATTFPAKKVKQTSEDESN
eukprot:c14985_g1_i1.p1 GENE.c14985_g1_i1~~c14985_g1_i1.p1  ORF type:complete len:256 (+),score=35.54 c14985_g1_i1:100-867(+)